MRRLCYLQVGLPQHGICRYGRSLAAEARRRTGLIVFEENIVLDGKFWVDRRRLRKLAQQLSSRVDRVHIQVSLWGDGSWGEGWCGLFNLWTFGRHCRVPLAITLHDINSLVGVKCGTIARIIRSIARGLATDMLRSGARLLKQALRGRLCKREIFAGLWNFCALYRCGLARIAANGASPLLVITSWEKDLLLSCGIVSDTVLIPHFVERAPRQRVTPVYRNSTSGKTILVAGFIFNQKGHRLVVEAMPLMPHVRVMFLGGPGVGQSGAEQYARIMDFVREKGVQDRLEVTGYLDDEEFQRHIRAADLAVCPFSEYKTASGSLSALIAAGCPILASDVPLIAEYNAMVPGAIPTFSPYSAKALATTISRLLTVPRTGLVDGINRLQKHLSISTIYSLHLDAYRKHVA